LSISDSDELDELDELEEFRGCFGLFFGIFNLLTRFAFNLSEFGLILLFEVELELDEDECEGLRMFFSI